MNSQELFLLPPTKTKLKTKKTSNSQCKNQAEQTNFYSTTEAGVNKNSNGNFIAVQPEELFTKDCTQTTPQASLNTRVNSKQKNKQEAVEAPHIKRCRQAIRSFCLECQGRLSCAVEACEDHDCKLYPFRKLATENTLLPKKMLDEKAEKMPEKTAEKMEHKPLRAVRQHCLICCGGERDEVRNCAAGKTCTLWPFRFGVNPVIYRKVKEKWRGPKHYTLPGL